MWQCYKLCVMMYVWLEIGLIVVWVYDIYTMSITWYAQRVTLSDFFVLKSHASYIQEKNVGLLCLIPVTGKSRSYWYNSLMICRGDPRILKYLLKICQGYFRLVYWVYPVADTAGRLVLTDWILPESLGEKRLCAPPMIFRGDNAHTASATRNVTPNC